MERIQYGGTELRVLLAAVTTVLGAGLLSSVAPALGGLVWLSAAVLAGLAVVVSAVRRELRIRRRLAEIQLSVRTGVRR